LQLIQLLNFYLIPQLWLRDFFYRYAILILLNKIQQCVQ
jgi:hypothetical protein